MEKTLNLQIRQCIELGLIRGCKRFIIYPFGDVGMQVKEILTNLYAIEPEYIIDNKYSKYNSTIKSTNFLDSIDCNEYMVILASTNKEIYCELKKELLKRFESFRILELECMRRITICGKHSFGPLCSHWLVESVGSFCSFAPGANVVINHSIDLISTHPFLYYSEAEGIIYEDYKDEYGYYISGVKPRGRRYKTTDNRLRITIGNDVWLGENVIVTNGANIGNGVIAGAGTVITKDVPDYAIVIGNPARVLRYRYDSAQIDALNKIRWWDWPDGIIRERYEDFYLPIDSFIEKYLGENTHGKN